MYVINGYEIIDSGSESYLFCSGRAAKMASRALIQILLALNTQKKREITEKKLQELALQYEVDINDLKQTLLCDTLKPEYNVQSCPKDFLDFQSPSLVIYYRQNYTDPDFKTIFPALRDEVYLITCGVLHQQLLIDNLYFNHSGLPNHFSNLHHVMKNACSDDRLSFYRRFYDSHRETLPTVSLNPCQRGYIAYSIYQFLARFVKFDGQPTPHDALNWRWQIDLLTFGAQKEVAILAEQTERGTAV